jgi:hypothetical protein
MDQIRQKLIKFQPSTIVQLQATLTRALSSLLEIDQLGFASSTIH